MICNIEKKRILTCVSFHILMFVLVLSVKAEIVTDNSFGKEHSIAPENNTYFIDAELGHHEGQNLFHSFKSFSIEKGMTANFTGPSTIQRIISRVTGGEMSRINGTIKSNIQGADFFLINSHGIAFEESAQLDIHGSFYVSTADYLQMTESEKFMTGSTETSGLVSSSPHSFGFLDAEIAPITFKGSEAISQDRFYGRTDIFKEFNTNYPIDNGLTVTGNNEFCIIGGKITIENGVTIGIKDSSSQTDMNETKGSIQLISINSQTDVYMNNMLEYSLDTKFDNISIKGSILNASGQTVGGIHIVGNDIFVENSFLNMDNFGTQNAPPIKLMGNNISFLQRAKILSNTFANGNAAPIHLIAKSDILFKDVDASIYSFSDQMDISDGKISGNTSSMSISAKNFYLQDGARILSRTFSSGHCNDISIQVDETIRLFSKNTLFNECSIFFDTYGPGNAGTIKFNAKIFELSNGAKLSVSTKDTGNGGSIIINAEEVHLKGIRNDQLSQPNQGSRIFVRTYGNTPDAGDSGDLTIRATNIIMDDGAQIKAQTSGYGRGGDLTLIATENIVVKGMDGRNMPAMINTSCDQSRLNYGMERSGNVIISAKNIELKDGAWISTHTEAKGNAGTINITAQKLKLSGECKSVNNVDKDKIPSCIISSAKPKSKGDGGTINIQANEILLSNGAYIETGTESSGNAGEIDIQANSITLMKTSSDHKSSMIESNTHAKQFDKNTHITGSGGKVKINAKNINLFDGARISTSSIADIESSGKAGDIIVNIGGTLRISGQNDKMEIDDKSSGIYARSESNNQAHADKAGNIDIIANNLVMDNNGLISTSSNGLSNAGDINIQTRQAILLTHSRIASDSKMPVNGDQNGGAAGSIKINSGGDLQLFQSAHITTNAVSSGGGKIDIQNQNSLTLINSGITTNVRQGEGNGGDINIRTDLTVMNHGIISANADAGDGGAIYIYTRNLIQSTDSRIEATSERGNDGTVEIETPDVEENQDLLNLSDNFLNTVKIVNTLCEHSNEQESIQLVINAPYIPNFSATWYQFSANASLSLLSKNVTDQFDNISRDFTDDALYQVE